MSELILFHHAQGLTDGVRLRPPSAPGGSWPSGVPVRIHMMESDPLVLPPNEDVAAAPELDFLAGP